MKTILQQDVASDISLRVLQSDIGYHFEVLKQGKLALGMYFLYGETIHKSVYSLGGAVYGLFHDDELAEGIMKVIEVNKDLLGGYELKR